MERGFAGRTLARCCRLLCGAVVTAQLAHADTQLLARVGTAEIDIAAFTRRAAVLAPFQWARLGREWPERRRRFLEEVLIPEALLNADAERLRPGWPAPRDTALSRALYAELAAELAAAGVSDEETSSYRERHRRHYETPRSLLLWRILVRGEVEARELIVRLHEPKQAEWTQLARDRSLDQATHLRAGSLGYVAADGQTHMPQVRVSPALFAAADRVADGALVPEPVREGDAFAVVWRRSSRAAEVRPWVEIEPEIRARVLEEKLAAACRDLTERLRRERLAVHRPELLAGFAPEFPEAVRGPLPTADAPAATRPVRLLPEPSERGLR